MQALSRNDCCRYCVVLFSAWCACSCRGSSADAGRQRPRGVSGRGASADAGRQRKQGVSGRGASAVNRCRRAVTGATELLIERFGMAQGVEPWLYEGTGCRLWATYGGSESPVGWMTDECQRILREVCVFILFLYPCLLFKH